MAGASPLLWVEAGCVPYATAYDWQLRLHARRVAGEVDDVVLLLEHPHVYTLGRRFRSPHLLVDDAALRRRGAEVCEADRGGSVTYHGPGQVVLYPVVDLRPSDGGLPDILGYLRLLEGAIIETVAKLGVGAGRRAGLTGVWVGGEKLASIGVNVSRGVAKHGLALNVSTDLSYFSAIVPCGIEGCTVTSLERLLGCPVDRREVGEILVREVSWRLSRDLRPAGLAELGLDLRVSAPAAVGA